MDKSFLDYSDFYDNNDDSDNPKIAQGYSYHNGPEWVWLYGYYVMAMVKFDTLNSKKFKR